MDILLKYKVNIIPKGSRDLLCITQGVQEFCFDMKDRPLFRLTSCKLLLQQRKIVFLLLYHLFSAPRFSVYLNQLRKFGSLSVFYKPFRRQAQNQSFFTYGKLPVTTDRASSLIISRCNTICTV